jgi:tetratricopeptide (TPR) repeat protein
MAESLLAETEIEPRVTATERAEIEAALALVAAGKTDEALRRLDAGRGGAAAGFMRGSLLFQQEKLPEAIAACEGAVAQYPKFRRAHRMLGILYVRQGDFDKALPALTRVLELGGGDAFTYGLLGYSNAALNRFLAAESAYRQAVLLDPVTLDWQMGLARALFRQERCAEASALCAALIEAHPERADLWLLQANALIGLNQPLKAAENFEIAARLGAATAESLNMLGDIYVNEGLYTAAVEAYQQALERFPEAGPDRPLRAAKVLVGRGALAEAKKLICRMDELHGAALASAERKDLLRLRARMAVAEGASGEEIQILQEILEIDPLDGEALILLGQHAGRARDLEKAVFYYERAAGLERFEADAKLRHAQLLAGQGRYAEALPLLRRAQELKPREDVQKYLDQLERLAKAR